MSKKLFYIIFLFCFIYSNANALNFSEIQTLAAKEARCSKDQPCTMSTSKVNNKFIVRVGRSISISSEGILLFKPSSVIHFIYTLDGTLEQRKLTP